jgi:hypothetical protein
VLLGKFGITMLGGPCQPDGPGVGSEGKMFWEDGVCDVDGDVGRSIAMEPLEP